MGRVKYSEEFKEEAVKQVLENGYSINDTAGRLGMHPDSLRGWIKRLSSPESKNKYKIEMKENEEIKRLRKELKRAIDERDILKKAAVYFANHIS